MKTVTLASPPVIYKALLQDKWIPDWQEQREPQLTTSVDSHCSMSSMMRAWVAGIWKKGSSEAEREWVSDRKEAECVLSHSATLM